MHFNFCRKVDEYFGPIICRALLLLKGALSVISFPPKNELQDIPKKIIIIKFMGIKLNKGKHLVWMEYRPVSLFIGLTVTLGGWIMVTIYLLRHSEACWNSLLHPGKERG